MAGDGSLDDAPTLRRCVRELAALSTLSAVWANNDLQQIADGLAGVVLRALPLSLVHVRVHGFDGSIAIEIARTPHGPVSAAATAAISEALGSVLANADAGHASIRDPFGAGDMRLLIVPLGYGGDCGHLVAGSDDPNFPTQIDRLMLGVAANQAAIVLQQKRDIAERKQAEKISRRLAAIVESSDDAITSTDLSGTITSWNRGAEMLYGYTAAEIIGRPIALLTPADHRDDFTAIMERLRRGERVDHYETVRLCKDGRRVDISLTVSPIRDDEGRLLGASKVARDITERKRQQDALATQTERLGLLWEAASVLLSAENPDAMLRGVFAKIGPHLGADTYINYMVTAGGDALTLSSAGLSADVAREIGRLDFEQAADRRAQLVKSLGLRAYACSPLLIGARRIGTLSFASRTKEHFDADEVAFIGTVSDYVTVAYERLRLLNELQDGDQRKNEFLATLAHELRNPLAPIRNAIKVLHLKGSDNPEATWGRGVIERQLQNLTRLVDDLLEISRISRNELELRKGPVELSEVINGAIEASRPLIEASRHELIVSLPAESLLLEADLVRLSQVFLNLLNNAAKYTERGGRIWVTAERRGNTVITRVKDTGVGIPAEQLPRLFEMFYQVDRSRERSQGGLGIGLSLVRRLVEFHGGTVQARSEGQGKGSEFIVTLPIRVEAPAGLAVPPGDPGPAVSTGRILVVDDNRDSADSLSMFLKLKGNEVVTAYDGIDGVEAAERFRPDAVLLDIGLPRLNGEDACRRIRASSWGRDVLLVAVTGWGQEEDRRRTLEAGFDAHLVKPVDPVEVMKLLAARQAERAR